ncbi:hypothetical protein JAAARDRAFT_47793 [Jaapia argillacea MUCL 33604]|uniref:Uncharacterized protein n=1 Tax=Jaapia argillacea MUCL 33604 TaxID=933084 RepID=A0A067PQQ5_9AGAM|nr:hypothetical protein JAAARDRAFT_47793 [Jaapia argillacea MUCL 33604]
MHFISYNHPPSPLTQKRRRLDAGAGAEFAEGNDVSPPIRLPTLLKFSQLISMDKDTLGEGDQTGKMDIDALQEDEVQEDDEREGEGEEGIEWDMDARDISPVQSSVVSTGAPIPIMSISATSFPVSPGTIRAQDALRAETFAHSLSLKTKAQGKKDMGGTYCRHVVRYQEWFLSDQSRRVKEKPSHSVLPAFPVTATKVAAFLEYEMSRPKGAVSALENWRLHHEHEYPNDPEAQKGLRFDSRIKAFEASVGKRETERTEKSQALKAVGASSGKPLSQLIA